MKTKTLLIVISSTALFFTSCEKDEMGIREGAGGGMQNSLNSKKVSTILIAENDTVITSKVFVGVIPEVQK